MEALLEKERVAARHVMALLDDRSQPIADMLKALGEYREVAKLCIFADFEAGEQLEARLWRTHTEGRKYFHQTLSNLRRASHQEKLVVAKRQCTKVFLYFLKDSHRFYHNFLQSLRATFPEVSELDLVARGLKISSSGESSQSLISPHLRSRILTSCHNVLIYIGDLSRYRAAEKLDEQPDYARAIGYYGLACSFRPSSGHGHHQQAVVFLEQRRHLPAVYELYRAIALDEPYPLAAKNLEIEFDKIREAKKKGTLLKPGHPKGPDMQKNTLEGWFVYLHCECFKGDKFPEYEALEREVISQLARLLTNDPGDLSRSLSRIVMVNMASQYTASERFKSNPTTENQQAFYFFFRFNLQTFTTFLQVFQDGMTHQGMMDLDDPNLASKLTPIAYRTLPVLRLYSAWLLPVVVLIDGLSSDEFIKPAVDAFWPAYIRAMDLVSQTFPIWELDDEPKVTYLLDEDAESVAFKPLVDEKTMSIWFDKSSGSQKPHRDDTDVEHVSIAGEMLARVQDLLNCAVSLAHDEYAPMKLHGTRFLHRDEPLPEPVLLETRPQASKPEADGNGHQPVVKPKPLTYAAAASASSTPKSHPKPYTGHRGTNGVPKTADQTQDESLTRMVDDLLDGDDNHPVTPPQQHVSNPAVADDSQQNNSRDIAQDTLPLASYQHHQKQLSRPMSLSSPPGLRTPRSPANANTSSERLQSVSNVWAQSPLLSASPQFPSGLPTGTLSSPVHVTSTGHSRVNSSNSIRSGNSQNASDLWSSLESSKQLPGLPTIGQNYSPFKPNMGTPLLFGASDRPWSTWANGAPAVTETYTNTSPPNGQGG